MRHYQHLAPRSTANTSPRDIANAGPHGGTVDTSPPATADVGL
ncbi:hypothetical protein [Dactylosporangium sp. NPDC048998]